MSEEVFHCYTAADKNDFSNWVRDVVGDVCPWPKSYKRSLPVLLLPSKVETRLGWLRARL